MPKLSKTVNSVRIEFSSGKGVSEFSALKLEKYLGFVIFASKTVSEEVWNLCARGNKEKSVCFGAID